MSQHATKSADIKPRVPRHASDVAGPEQIAKVLTGSPRSTETNTTRLDLTGEFNAVLCGVNDLKNLARCAELIYYNLREQSIAPDREDGAITLYLIAEQVEAYAWITQKLVEVGTRTDKACEEFEDLLASRDARVHEPVEGEA